MSSTLEPSEAFWATTKYGVKVPRVRRIFYLTNQVWVQLWPPSLLTKRTRVPLVHSADESPNPHQHAVHLLKDQLPKWSPGVETRQWQPLYLWGSLPTPLECHPWGWSQPHHPTNWQASAKSIRQRTSQIVVVLSLANDCRAHSLLPYP
jgi:hypothetical protein